MEAPMPPPPPELWNFAVVLVLGAIMLWSARLMQMLLTFLDVRHAASADARLRARECVHVAPPATAAIQGRDVRVPHATRHAAFQLLQPTLTITRASIRFK
ncbi:hypothetical protein PINS_up023075 [Pythium insidiosum]|nr:hypothetical protein PINS_up023075 [Pythium insidiosum]